MTIKIAVDCMGGDHGPSVTVPASLAFLAREADVRLLLVGRQESIQAALNTARATPSHMARIEIRHAEQVVEMDDAPALALRSKRRSSMRKAIEAVRDGDADACVSAGNSGALMAISRFVLRMLPGIDRPAMAAQLPNRKGRGTTVLDLGANVDCTPNHLVQFALMGSALVTALDEHESPSIGLLNIGEEVIKGNETVKQAAELLRASNLNFSGNVEGNDIYEGTVDVVVADGFVGNVLLKTSEGMAQMFKAFVREEFERNWFSKLVALLSYPVLSLLKRRLDPGRYNGASLIGLKGIVFKSHGSADQLSFETALNKAFHAARNGLLDRIQQALADIQQTAKEPEQKVASS